MADGIAGARSELRTGPGSRHCLHLERLDDLLAVLGAFLADHTTQTC